MKVNYSRTHFRYKLPIFFNSSLFCSMTRRKCFIKTENWSIFNFSQNDMFCRRLNNDSAQMRVKRWFSKTFLFRECVVKRDRKNFWVIVIGIWLITLVGVFLFLAVNNKSEYVCFWCWRLWMNDAIYGRRENEVGI